MSAIISGWWLIGRVFLCLVMTTYVLDLLYEIGRSRPRRRGVAPQSRGGRSGSVK